MKNSPQYKSVLTNKGKIEQRLRVQPGAKDKLITKLQEKEWLEIGETPTVEAIMNCVLVQLEEDTTAPAEYKIFIEMLQGITGLKQIVDLLEQTGKKDPIEK